MMTNRFFPVALWTASLLATTGLANAGDHILSVEPYLIEWCADQFPDQLGDVVTGQSQAEMLRDRDYVRVEAYLGRYCFDIFGRQDLKEQKKDETLKKMHGKHVQVEPYLMEWGQKAMLTPTSGGGGLAVPDVERYVTEWCVKGQFHKLMKDSKAALEHAKQYPVRIEVALGPWCFAQFPNEMANLDQEFYIKRLRTDHIPIEDYLLKWEMTNFHMRDDPAFINQDDAQSGWSAALTKILLAFGVVAAIAYVHKRHPGLVPAAGQRIQQLFPRNSQPVVMEHSERYAQLTESMVQFT